MSWHEKQAIKKIAISKKAKSKSLFLDRHGLVLLPKELKELVWLEELDLSYNRLISLRILGEMPNLRKVNLKENEISDLTPLLSSHSILQLDISNNKLTSLTGIGSLRNLIELDASKNSIENVEELESLRRVRRLLLNDNCIEDIYPLSKLLLLEKVDISNNNITDISFLFDLKKISFVEAINNKIEEIPPNSYSNDLELIWELNRPAYKSGVNVFNNPIVIPPVEIIKRGKLATDIFLKSLIKSNPKSDVQEYKTLNQAKIILIGDGGAGKTSLVKRLLDQEFDPQEIQTSGISINHKDVRIKDEDIKVSIWDFGGQEIMHSTHQFFLSKRSLYMILVDSRQEGKVEYWLKHVESFGGTSPVLMIINKIDENPSFDLNRRFLTSKYPNIKGFLKISCKTSEGLDELYEVLTEEIYSLDMRKTPFPETWLNVKEALDNMDDDYIKYESYYDICKENNVLRPSVQQTLLQLLHDLGTVLAFKSLELYDTQVINPVWLTNGVYRIITSSLVYIEGGYLFLKDLDDILNGNINNDDKFHYPKNTFLYIVRMMMKFELCYEVSDGIFLIPDLLPVEERPLDFDYSSSLHFTFDYEFYPTSIFSRFVFQFHDRIVQGKLWRTGAFIVDNLFQAEAVVKSDKEDRKIFIWVNCKDRRRRRDFFEFIRNVFNDIHKTFEKLDYRELVPIPEHPEVQIDYKELVGYERMGVEEYVVGILEKRYLVADLLNGLEGPKNRQKIESPPIKIFLTYSKEDQDFRDAFRKYLEPLSRSKLIEIWDEGDIEAGRVREEEIMMRLNNAEMIFCLISADFLNTDFYRDTLEAFLSQSSKRGKRIVPVIVRYSLWNDLPIGKIKGIPSEPIADPKNDKAWFKVYESLKDLIDTNR